jgi:hypothetical protein
LRAASLGFLFRGALAAGVLALAALTPARASLETDLLDRWYALLERADTDGLSGLLARSAKIELNDLGVTQTKQQFLASMDEWRAAIDGGSIRYRIETTAAGSAIALVCYDFASNDLLTRETFTFVAGHITRSQQRTVAKECGDI